MTEQRRLALHLAGRPCPHCLIFSPSIPSSRGRRCAPAEPRLGVAAARRPLVLRPAAVGPDRHRPAGLCRAGPADDRGPPRSSTTASRTWPRCPAIALLRRAWEEERVVREDPPLDADGPWIRREVIPVRHADRPDRADRAGHQQHGRPGGQPAGDRVRRRRRRPVPDGVRRHVPAARSCRASCTPDRARGTGCSG